MPDLEGERADAHEEMARERWAGHREQHAAEKELSAARWDAHDDQHEAIARNLGEYKAQSNEWRGTLADFRGTFAPVSRIESLEADMDRRYNELRTALLAEREERRDQQNLRVGAQRGISQGTAIIVGAVGLVGGVLAIVVVVANLLGS
jgi:hypothetical protein